MVNLADMGKTDKPKPDNPSWMYHIASFTVAQYWRDYYYRTYGIDCGHCSNPQRKRCKEQDLYCECPKAIRIESLDRPVVDEDGHITKLGDLIADDKALDLPEWRDESTFLLGYPQRLSDIAHKRLCGIPLDAKDKMYLHRFRQKHQESLF
jgi:hypothetical protein